MKSNDVEDGCEPTASVTIRLAYPCIQSRASIYEGNSR
jgi:hypothetical protein